MSITKRMFVDIETSPNLLYHWRTGYKENITHESIIREREIIMIRWKWEGSTKIYGLKWKWNGVLDKKARDKDLLVQFSKEYIKADEIIAQNGLRFDVPWITGRLMILGLPPLPKVNMFDTLRETKKHMNLNSYKLDYLDKVTGGPGKLPTKFDDWIKITHHNNQKALNYMYKYNGVDVERLEAYYRKVRPYIPEKINQKLIDDGRGGCTVCGAFTLNISRLYTSAMGIKYKQYRCRSCGKYKTLTNQVKKGE